MGEVAKAWAKQFFDGAVKVRVERDHPAEIRDRFNRYLAYAFAQKDGAWVNFNVEVVRAGMSPYFTKYGYSRRFHDEFVAAEAEAQAAKRGIWAPGVMNYPDYPERKAWWTPRGDFVAKFRTEGEGKANYIDITHWDALQQLEAHVGKEVHLLGTVGDVRIGERGPARVTLSRRMFNDFPLVFFDRDVLGTSGISQWKSEYVWVTGRADHLREQDHQEEAGADRDRPRQSDPALPGPRAHGPHGERRAVTQLTRRSGPMCDLRGMRALVLGAAAALASSACGPSPKAGECIDSLLPGDLVITEVFADCQGAAWWQRHRRRQGMVRDLQRDRSPGRARGLTLAHAASTARAGSRT